MAKTYACGGDAGIGGAGVAARCDGVDGIGRPVVVIGLGCLLAGNYARSDFCQ
jgi:hypothetical protein